MNPLPDSENTIAPGERFVDAALREHARDDSPTDSELVHRILAETINRQPRRLESVQPRLDRQTLLVGSIAVAALIALVIVTLSSLPFSSDRGTDEFRLVLHGFVPGNIDEPFLPDGNPKRPVFPFEGKVDPVSQFVQLDTIELSAGNALPYIEPFAPSLESFPEKADRERRFRISADRIERNGDSIYYTGNVVVDHSEFRIEAESVTVNKARAEGPWISATTARVEQPAAGRFVSAGNLTFDPVAVEMRLIDVVHFTTGGKRQTLESEDTLILSALAYTVESPKTISYASPGK